VITAARSTTVIIPAGTAIVRSVTPNRPSVGWRCTSAAFWLAIFRVAILNSRLERFENGLVTFRYRDNRTHQIEHRTLCAEEFLRRFFSHVLPRGLVKVRSYGLWSANNSDKLDKARGLLASAAPPPTGQPIATPPPPLTAAAPMLCPQCKIGHLIWVQCLLPQQTRAP
jgi:hypothetical protein